MEFLKPKRFLAVGECMVEFAPLPGNSASDIRYGRAFAGDTFNTAWYVKRLLGDDCPVAYHTAIGDDAISDEMLAFMAASGIDTSGIARCSDRTVGLYTISVTDGERSFSYWRSLSAARLLMDHAIDWKTGDAALYVSGITLAILSQQDREKLIDVMAEARARGQLVAFDPNIRPRLWEDAASMRDTLTAASGKASLVLPSFDDEATHFGDATPQATGERYLKAGAAAAMVKNGAHAGFYQDNREMTFEEMPKEGLEPVDTTGAGDSFNAGFLAAVIEGRTSREAAQRGTSLAARVVLHPGALFDPSDAEALEYR